MGNGNAFYIPASKVGSRWRFDEGGWWQVVSRRVFDSSDNRLKTRTALQYLYLSCVRLIPRQSKCSGSGSCVAMACSLECKARYPRGRCSIMGVLVTLSTTAWNYSGAIFGECFSKNDHWTFPPEPMIYQTPQIASQPLKWNLSRGKQFGCLLSVSSEVVKQWSSTLLRS